MDCPEQTQFISTKLWFTNYCEFYLLHECELECFQSSSPRRSVGSDVRAFKLLLSGPEVETFKNSLVNIYFTTIHHFCILCFGAFVWMHTALSWLDTPMIRHSLRPLPCINITAVHFARFVPASELNAVILSVLVCIYNLPKLQDSHRIWIFRSNKSLHRSGETLQYRSAANKLSICTVSVNRLKRIVNKTWISSTEHTSYTPRILE